MPTPKGVLDFGFMLGGEIAPTHDILWHVAGDKGRAAFWRQAARVGHGVFQLQMSAGIDRLGRAFVALKQSTIDRRRSAMTNHPDRNAPPFIPGHELSRTVSYLRAKVMQGGVWFYWLMDRGLRIRWGQVLDWHRRHMVRGAPVRDVFGFAPESIARIKKDMAAWWAKNRVSLATGGTVDAVMPNPNRVELVNRLAGIGNGTTGRPTVPTPVPAPSPMKPLPKPIAGARPTGKKPTGKPLPPVPPKPQPTTVNVPLHGVTHIDRMADAQGSGPRRGPDGTYTGLYRKKRVNDVSKLRNAPKPGAPKPPAQPKYRDFKNKEASMTEWTQKAFGQWAKDITPEERKHLAAYGKKGYEQVNGLLRGNYKGEIADPESVRESIASLDAAIARGTVPENITVWRGIYPAEFGITDVEHLKGATIHDKGFVSTSLSQETAQHGQFNGGVTFKIRVPKGANAASIASIVPGTDEQEILLPRGGRVVVTGISANIRGYIVEGDWMP